jgi:hypothetical protein
MPDEPDSSRSSVRRGRANRHRQEQEQEQDPTSEDNDLRVEQVDEVGESNAEYLDGLINDLAGNRITLIGQMEKALNLAFFIGRGLRTALSPAFNDRGAANVRLQTTSAAASARATLQGNLDMTPLALTAGVTSQQHTVMEEAGPDAAPDERGDAMLGRLRDAAAAPTLCVLFRSRASGSKTSEPVRSAMACAAVAALSRDRPVTITRPYPSLARWMPASNPTPEVAPVTRAILVEFVAFSFCLVEVFPDRDHSGSARAARHRPVAPITRRRLTWVR